MVQKKRLSKRVPLHKKYKIKRKIKEHHRKIRKLAKKNPQLVQKKLKKDPGIPNLYPFKEELLHKIEAQKQKVEEEKQRQKEARKKELTKKRSSEQTASNPRKDLAELQADALKREKEFHLKQQQLLKHDDPQAAGLKDGSMQAYYREFRRVVEVADVVIEVLDARDPLGCRCPDIERMIVSKYPSKRIVLLLNKIDLVPKDIVEKWLKHLRNEYATIAFKSNTQGQRSNIGQSAVPVSRASEGMLQSSESLGADTLLQLLKHYAKSGKLRTSITVGLIGYPNVGKSSVINSLCRARAVKVGGTPGVTKTAQEIHLDKHVKLLDTPGIVFPKANEADADIILRNCVKVEQVADPVGPVEAILQRCKKEQLLAIYKIPTFGSCPEFLGHVAKKRGKLAKGGIPDLKAAARTVLQDWTGGKIPFYTEPPEASANIHVSASIVPEWSKGFDFDQSQVLSSLPDIDPVQSVNMMALAPGSRSSDSMFLDLNSNIESQMLDQGEVDIDSDDDSDDQVDQTRGTAGGDDMSDITSTQDLADKPKPKTRTQDLHDEADKYNPQVNRELRKKQKKEQKKKKKFGKVVQTDAFMEDDNDNYNFAVDFVQDGRKDDDEDDIDVEDIIDD